jgi:hypothetical protein
MSSAELAMLPSSPSFAATLGGAVNSHILVVDVRKSTDTRQEGASRNVFCTFGRKIFFNVLLAWPTGMPLLLFLNGFLQLF